MHLQRWQVPCRLHSLEWVWSIPLHVWVAQHLPSNLTTGMYMYFREQDILYLHIVETGQVLTSKVLCVWQQLEVCDCILTSRTPWSGHGLLHYTTETWQSLWLHAIGIVGKTSRLPTNRVQSLHCHVSYTSRGEGDYIHNSRVTPISTTPTAATGTQSCT